MSKTIANLYKKIITNDKLKIDNKEEILLSLELFPIKTVKQLIKKYNLSQGQLEEFCNDNFSKYISFVIIGCPHSTDIDVCCIVNESYQSNGKTYPLLADEINRLNNEIYDKLGYDKSRKLDINFITVKNNNITSLSKGGKETQNIILSTYDLHKQKYECPNLEFVKIDILEKCKTIAKFYLDHLEDISIDYQLIRESKKRAYQTTYDMLEFSKTVIGNIDICNLNDKKEWNDTMKSLTMKIIQLILLKNNIYEYTKEGMINQVKIFGFNEDELTYLLFRGNKGIKSNIFTRLHDEYVKILEEYLNNIDKNIHEILFCDINIHYKNNFKHFFDSPNIATEQFQKSWNQKFNDKSINSIFKLESSNQENRNILLQYFDEKYHKNFIWINQRSEEWLKLLKFYTCGNNSKEIQSGFNGKFNLIRGAIAEQLIIDNFIFEDFNKISLGLLVKDTKEGSKGCAPDLILVNDKEIIPVEIKCLKSDKKNSDYYDSLILAQKQCETVKNIFNSFNCNLIKKKIIILSWFTENKLIYEVNTINF